MKKLLIIFFLISFTLTGCSLNFKDFGLKEKSGDIKEKSGDIKEKSGDIKEKSGDIKGRSGDLKEKSGDLNNKNNDMENVKEVRLGDTIRVDYVGTFMDGKVFDTSLEKKAKEAGVYNSARNYEPLEFTTGKGQMISGFDKGVIGMKEGESKEMIIEPKDAYGECDDSLIRSFKKSDFKKFEQEGFKIEEGEKLPIPQYGMIEIVKVTDDNISLDFNHELCGENLKFTVTIVEVK